MGSDRKCLDEFGPEVRFLSETRYDRAIEYRFRFWRYCVATHVAFRHWVPRGLHNQRKERLPLSRLVRTAFGNLMGAQKLLLGEAVSRMSNCDNTDKTF